MKIDRIRSLHVSAEWNYQEPLGEAHLSRPASIYPELADGSNLAASKMYPAGGPPYTVEAPLPAHRHRRRRDRHLRPSRRRRYRHHQSLFRFDILIGEDPHAIERIWDKMYRHSIHGRKGTPMMALEQGRSGALGPEGQAA